MRTPSYIGQADLEYKMRVDNSLLKSFNIFVAIFALVFALVPLMIVDSTPLAIPSLFDVTFWNTFISPFNVRGAIMILLTLVLISYLVVTLVWLIIPSDDIDNYRNRMAKTNLVYLGIVLVTYVVFYAIGWITLTEGLMVPISYPWLPFSIPAFPSFLVSLIGWFVIASLGNAAIGEGNPSNRRIILFQFLALLAAIGSSVSLVVNYYVRQGTIPIIGYNLFSFPGLIYHPDLEAMLTFNEARFALIEPIGIALLNLIVVAIVVSIIVHFLTFVFNKPIKWLSILSNSLLLGLVLVSVYFTFTYFEVYPTNPAHYLGIIIIIVGSIAGILFAAFGIKELDHDHYPFVIQAPNAPVDHPIEPADLTAAPLPAAVPLAEPISAKPVEKKETKPFTKPVLLVIELVVSILFIALLFVDFYTRLGVSIRLIDLVTQTSSTVVTMLTANSANWLLASLVAFDVLAGWVLRSAIILLILNLVLRVVTLVIRRPLRILSLVLSSTLVFVALLLFYFSFTFFEVYWNQPLTYLGVLVILVVAIVHFLIALLVLKPAKAPQSEVTPVVSAPVEASTQPVGSEPLTQQPLDSSRSTIVEAIPMDEEVYEQENTTPVPLPTVELETINVFEMPSVSVPIRTVPRSVAQPRPQPTVVEEPVKSAPTPQPQPVANEPVIEPIRPVEQPKPMLKPIAESITDSDEVEDKPFAFARSTLSDSLYINLDTIEKAEFKRYYIDPGVDHKVPYLQYVIGGDNSQFFSNVFYYMSRYRKVISVSLLTKIYDHIKSMLGDDYSEISHLNTQLIRIYFSRRNEPGVMKLLIAKCKEDIDLNLNTLKVHDMYLYSFKRLVMVHEAMGNYTEAKRWVELALELNLDDKTKGGYPARLQRIKSKIHLYTDN